MSAPQATIEERFWRHVEIVGECWIWTGYLNPRGYAMLSMGRGRSPALAHRWSYEHHVGPIPDGLQIDHLCHTLDLNCPGGAPCQHRRCVNPGHLEPVSAAENMARGRWAQKTHCPKGHEYDEANTYHGRSGRTCRRCRADGELRRKRERQ